MNTKRIYGVPATLLAALLLVPGIFLFLAAEPPVRGESLEEMAEDVKGEKREVGVYRFSYLSELKVVDHEGKSIGEVHDILLNPETGEVVLVTIRTPAGWLRWGRVEYAVAPQSLELRPHPTRPREEVVLNVTEQQLEGAAVLDDENFADITERVSALDPVEARRQPEVFRVEREAVFGHPPQRERPARSPDPLDYPWHIME